MGCGYADALLRVSAVLSAGKHAGKGRYEIGQNHVSALPPTWPVGEARRLGFCGVNHRIRPILPAARESTRQVTSEHCDGRSRRDDTAIRARYRYQLPTTCAEGKP